MNTANTCPQCHTPLPADAPAGLCPRCLIRSAAGLAEPPPDVDFPDIGDAADVARRMPQFEIIEMLGKGGMGVVYKARQPALDRLVALKILPPADALSPDFVERFRREARALAKLNHPNIVAIHECGEQGGLYFFVMEYVDGANLRQLFEAGKLTPAEALAIVPKICDALEYAHEEGVIHRDIKPENLLIDKKGRVKIADFGLAKLLRREPLDMTLTLSGMALGTMRYMAPEQMEKPETVDHRADIYSLGIVIYEMLTGDVPMGHFELPSQKAQVDVRLDKIVLHAMERDAERRYQHASEVKTDVENVTRKPQAMPAPPPDARFCRFAIVGAVLAVFGLLAVLPVLFFIGLNRVWNGTAQPTDLIYAAPPLAFTIFMGALLAVGAAAPIGTTVLGAVSISRIRHSGGRTCGLPLAAFDVLFFPLLAVFVAVVSVTGFKHGWGFITGYGAIPAGIVCFFIGRAAWRSISGKGAASTSARNYSPCDPRSRVRAPGEMLLLVAGVALLTALGIGGWLWADTALHPESNFRPGHGQQGFAPIAMAVVIAGYGLFISAAGLFMRRLSGRMFVLICLVLVGLFIPAALALNCIQEAKNISQWPVLLPLWLGMPACLRAVLVLFRDDVREAFARTPDAHPGDGSGEVSGAVQTSDQPRLSRLALIGAIWVTLGPFCAAIIYFLYYAYRMGPGLTLVCIAFGVIGISSIIGGTLTSTVAVGHIRKSNGQLTGLPLAAFGVSLYPLLLLGTAAFGLTHLIQIALWTKVHTGYSYDTSGHLHDVIAPPPDSYPGMTFMVLDSIIALIVCFFAGRTMWRKGMRGAVAATPVRQPRPPGAWTPLEIAATGTTAFAFVLGGINALFDLARNSSPIQGVTLAAIVLAAACVAALLIAQQFRPVATPARAAMPELFLPALAACTGGLDWSAIFSGITGWNFWHGAGFAVLNFLLALFLLITSGAGLGRTRALAVLFTGLTGFALVLWWNAVPVGVIGDTGSFLFSGGGPVSITRKPVLAGAYIAAALAVLTAITGALRLRVALVGNRE